MGVKHFYLWYSRRFRSCVSTNPPRPLDILCIDMNGLFHYCAQEVFEYGVFSKTAPPQEYQGLLGRQEVRHPKIKMTPSNLTRLYQKVGYKVMELVRRIQPRHSLILCVDGVAGLAKMNQQRQRRFRGALQTPPVWPQGQSTITLPLQENPPQDEFHPNMFTPGTWVMDQMTRYLDWFLRCTLTNDIEWRHLQVVFSNEKVPGEGEHKLMNYLRHHSSPNDKICIYGLDADLVMLSMVLPREHVYIGREADADTFEYIHVRSFKREVLKEMDWRPSLSSSLSFSQRQQIASFCSHRAVYDFVVLCFLVGNDFLPTMPSLAIIEGSLEEMMEVYRTIGQEHGHLTLMYRQQPRIRWKVLLLFFQAMALKEISFLSQKYQHLGKTSSSFFTPDPLFMKYFHHSPQLSSSTITSSSSSSCLSTCSDEEKKQTLWKECRDEYWSKHFPSSISKTQVIQSYMEGIQWILSYYTCGIPDWTWFYPYLYAPFFQDIVDDVKMNHSWKGPCFQLHEPVPPFLQLLLVLPPTHSFLWPSSFQQGWTQSMEKKQMSEELHQLFSTLMPCFPTEITLDKGGKKKDWEAVIQLPPIHLYQFQQLYDQWLQLYPCQEREMKRNQNGKTWIYKYQSGSVHRPFLSYYGNIDPNYTSVQPFSLTSSSSSSLPLRSSV